MITSIDLSLSKFIKLPIFSLEKVFPGLLIIFSKIIFSVLFILNSFLFLIINSFAGKLSDYGYSDDLKGVKKILGELNGPYDHEIVENLIIDLGANEFSLREKATIRLSNMPLIDRKKLLSRLSELSLEQKIRVQRILKKNSEENLCCAKCCRVYRLYL